MVFNPNLKIGDKINNEQVQKLFQCGNMSGMRSSNKTKTLVIISDYTKELYTDDWDEGVLHYTGTGQKGNQRLDGNPGYKNGILYDSKTNGFTIHLFEVFESKVYTYAGIVELIDKPYQAKQNDIEGKERLVWRFPVKPTSPLNIEDIEEKELSKWSNEKLMRRIQRNAGVKKITKTEKLEYYRDPCLKELVKRIAEGKCQYCGNNAPFNDKYGKPYLEEHHIKWLSNGGSDTIDNVVALCPNCHRKMHVLNELNDIMEMKNVAKENEIQSKRYAGYIKIWNKTVEE